MGVFLPRVRFPISPWLRHIPRRSRPHSWREGGSQITLADPDSFFVFLFFGLSLYLIFCPESYRAQPDRTTPLSSPIPTERNA